MQGSSLESMERDQKYITHTTFFEIFTMQSHMAAEKWRVNNTRLQYCANKRMKVSEMTYVPQAINLQDDTRSIMGSTESRSISEQNNDYSSIMGDTSEQAQARARNPTNMN